MGLPSQCPAFSLGIGFIFLVLSTATSGQFAGDGGAVLHVAGRTASTAPPWKPSGPSVMLTASRVFHSCRSCCDRESPSWSLNPHLHPSREGLLFSPDEGPLLWWVCVWVGGWGVRGWGEGGEQQPLWVGLTGKNKGKKLPGRGIRREGRAEIGRKGPGPPPSRAVLKLAGPHHVKVDVWAPRAAVLT